MNANKKIWEDKNQLMTKNGEYGFLIPSPRNGTDATDKEHLLNYPNTNRQPRTKSYVAPVAHRNSQTVRTTGDDSTMKEV